METSSQGSLFGLFRKYRKQTLVLIRGFVGGSPKGCLGCLLDIISSTQVSFQFSSLPKPPKSTTVFGRTQLSGSWIRQLAVHGPPKRQDSMTCLWGQKDDWTEGELRWINQMNCNSKDPEEGREKQIHGAWQWLSFTQADWVFDTILCLVWVLSWYLLALQ